VIVSYVLRVSPVAGLTTAYVVMSLSWSASALRGRASARASRSVPRPTSDEPSPNALAGCRSDIPTLQLYAISAYPAGQCRVWASAEVAWSPRPGPAGRHIRGLTFQPGSVRRSRSRRTRRVSVSATPPEARSSRRRRSRSAASRQATRSWKSTRPVRKAISRRTWR
jgi:hypothetical protein